MHGPNWSFHLYEHEWNELSTNKWNNPSTKTICKTRKPPIVLSSHKCDKLGSNRGSNRNDSESFFSILENCLSLLCFNHPNWSYGCSKFSNMCGSVLEFGWHHPKYNFVTIFAIIICGIKGHYIILHSRRIWRIRIF